MCSSLQNLDRKYFWPHFEKQDGRHRRFFSVMKSTSISLIIGPRGLECGVVGFDLRPLLLGQTRIAKLKSAHNLLIIGPRGLGW